MHWSILFPLSLCMKMLRFQNPFQSKHSVLQKLIPILEQDNFEISSMGFP